MFYPKWFPKVHNQPVKILPLFSNQIPSTTTNWAQQESLLASLLEPKSYKINTFSEYPWGKPIFNNMKNTKQSISLFLLLIFQLFHLTSQMQKCAIF